MTRFRIADEAVFKAIERIAGLHCRFMQCGQFGQRDAAVGILKHGHAIHHVRGEQRDPVIGWGSGNNTVIIVRIFLGFDDRLPTAG